jgi:hypothetical protein
MAEIVIEKLKRFKSPGINKILSQLIPPSGNVLRSDIHKLIYSVWNKANCQFSGRELLLCLCIRREINATVVIIGDYLYYQLRVIQTFIQHSSLKLPPYADEIFGDRQCGF